MTSKNESRLTSLVGVAHAFPRICPHLQCPRSLRDSVSCARRRKAIFPLHLERNERERRPSHGIGRGARMMTANSSAQAANARSSLAWNPQPRHLRGAEPGREKMPVEPNASRVMKIMIFSVKLDKFTGFFDKFLNLLFQISYYNSDIYANNLTSCIQIWRQKKFFGSPAFPRNSPHLRAGRHLSLGRAAPLGPTPERGEKAKEDSRMQAAQHFPRLFARLS